MKIKEKKISHKNGEGRVVLVPEYDEDMWHAYHLIAVEDMVTCHTFRKVIKQTDTVVNTQKIRIQLTIKVKSVDFDPKDCCIRLNGTTINESKFVQKNSHHTLELEPFRAFTLSKTCWDSIFLRHLDIATNPMKSAQISAIIMEAGLAHICLITDHMTLVRSKIEKSLPKKHRIFQNFEKAYKQFFESIIQSMITNLDFDLIKVIILASPGHVKDDFFNYIIEQIEKRPELRHMKKIKNQFILVHSSSGHKHALSQVLADPGLQKKLIDTKAIQEVKVLNEFFMMLNNCSSKVFYTYDHVKEAQERGVIDSLLITDTLFRSSDIETRKKYVKLVEDTKESNGKVYIFSALHPSGEQLAQLSGVATILKYSLPEIDALNCSNEGSQERNQSEHLYESENDNNHEDLISSSCYSKNLDLIKDMFSI